MKIIESQRDVKKTLRKFKGRSGKLTAELSRFPGTEIRHTMTTSKNLSRTLKEMGKLKSREATRLANYLNSAFQKPRTVEDVCKWANALSINKSLSRGVKRLQLDGETISEKFPKNKDNSSLLMLIFKLTQFEAKLFDDAIKATF